MTDTLEAMGEIAHYHRCIAARAKRNAASDTLSGIERRAAESAAKLHEDWAETLDNHILHLTAEVH